MIRKRRRRRRGIREQGTRREKEDFLPGDGTVSDGFGWYCVGRERERGRNEEERQKRCSEAINSVALEKRCQQSRLDWRG